MHRITPINFNNTYYAPTEDFRKKMPKVAVEVISTSLERLIPTMDMDPEIVEQTKQVIEQTATEIVNDTKTGRTGVVPLTAISSRFGSAAEGHSQDDPVISRTLQNIAQEIARRTGQKPGTSGYTPSALVIEEDEV